MDGLTFVASTSVRCTEKWRVFQVRTENSTYTLEVQGGLGRRCAVLTCIAPPERAGVTYEDSGPQVGDVSLFEASPIEWIGKRLLVGTAKTSAVQAVDFLTATDRPAAPVAARQGTFTITAANPAPAPQPREERAWSAYPVGPVEMAEAAASVLRSLAHDRLLEGALAGNKALTKRLQLALETCRALLDEMPRSTCRSD